MKRRSIAFFDQDGGRFSASLEILVRPSDRNYDRSNQGISEKEEGLCEFLQLTDAEKEGGYLGRLARFICISYFGDAGAIHRLVLP
jgi:hypothetical protein